MAALALYTLSLTFYHLFSHRLHTVIFLSIENLHRLIFWVCHHCVAAESGCGRDDGDVGMVSGCVFGVGIYFLDVRLGRSEKLVWCRARESGIWGVERASRIVIACAIPCRNQ